MRVFSDDLESALSRRAGHKITVDRTPSAELDRLLSEYIRSTFLVKSRDGTPLAFTWIGHELKDADQHLWLYFERSLPSGIDGTRFAHRVLRDVFADQLNSVIVRDHPAASSAEKKSEPTRQLTLLFPDNQERVAKFP